MSSPLVWLITGTSSGIGRELTLAVLKRGDKVIATGRARSLNKLSDLKTAGADVLELDVTLSESRIKEIAKQAVAIHGHVDVVVNNAGYIEVGALEENTAEETLNEFNTNVFGGLNVTRAFLPYMRERKSGTVVWIGSIAGRRALPYGSLYAATKHAVRGISETLNAELEPLGMHSYCIEPGYFRTSFLTADNRGAHKARIDDYKPITDMMNQRYLAYSGKQPGDPQKLCQVVIDVVKREGIAKDRVPPPTIALGSDAYDIIKTALNKHMNDLEEWKDIAFSTDLPKA